MRFGKDKIRKIKISYKNGPVKLYPIIKKNGYFNVVININQMNVKDVVWCFYSFCKFNH